MLTIKVLSNENNTFLNNLPQKNNVEILAFTREEKNELYLGDINDKIHAVIINNCIDYFNSICLMIKKRIPIFIYDFHNLPTNKGKILLDLSQEADSYIQVNSSNRFVFNNKNYWNSIIDPQIISITKSFNKNELHRLKELIYIEIENIISLIKSKPRKIYPTYIPKKINDIQTIDFRIEFDNGAIFKMIISNVIPESTHTIEFIKWNDYQKIDLIKCEHIWNNKKEFFSKNNQPKQEEITHFCTNLLNNRLPDVNIEDGLITNELIDKIIY
jgi:hypothetical protein